MAPPSKSFFNSINKGFMVTTPKQTLNENGMSNGHNGHGDDDSMVIMAGIGFPSPDQGKGQELTGSFVKVEMNGHHTPTNVETSVIKQSSDGQREVTPKPTTPIAKRRQGDIATVSFSQATQQPHGNHRGAGYCIPDPFPTFQVDVVSTLDKQTYSFTVRQEDTVNYLKELVIKRLGICADRIRSLTYQDKPLKGEDTLKNCGIKGHCVIVLHVLFMIHVKNGNNHNRIINILVTYSDTVDYLQSQIQAQVGIPAAQQKLICAGGKTLQAGHKLSEYDIHEGSEIYLTGRLRGG